MLVCECKVVVDVEGTSTAESVEVLPWKRSSPASTARAAGDRKVYRSHS